MAKRAAPYQKMPGATTHPNQSSLPRDVFEVKPFLNFPLVCSVYNSVGFIVVESLQSIMWTSKYDRGNLEVTK